MSHAYGRVQVPETPETLACLHVHDFSTTLKAVAHPPRLGVLDQEDLFAQGIDTSQLIPGAQRVDALGSCTANATIAKLSSFLPIAQFEQVIAELSGVPTPFGFSFAETVTPEKASIVFYHRCTDQTVDPGQEWPPTDCGSSGPYIVEMLQSMGICSGARIASGADNIVSLLQSGSLLMGSPFLNVWEEPGPDGMIDGDGSAATLHSQIAQGVAGGHETLIYAIEKLTVLPTGHVDPHNTILLHRNSWSSSWGDNGDFRSHLSTWVALGGQCDLRLLMH